MKTRKLLWIILAIALLGVGLYFVLSRAEKAKTDEIGQAQALDITFNKQGELFFIASQKGDTLATIEIEIADNEQSRAQGLMYRKSIPENAGMLFIQDEEDIQSFWMKNTFIPLDMIFANANKNIVTIQTNTTPLQEWSYSSSAPALYVIEVNAGYCAAKGIKTGDTFDYNQ
ncbi:MAG: DUF192 domain-containing protein [Dysgonamonadaceae bacterium]|jgi:uncharacterized membrane protein (UPF0127 family)|nr:DUF192 domain-containing protein [Dysgonamonadaceae bacterium]